jgi:drug/metabolite transporter (DMT)-like permease
MSIGRDKVKGILLVLLASMLWGGSGTLTKILKTRGSDIFDIFAWRYLFGLASLGAMRLVFQRGQSLALEGRALRMTLFSALVILTVSGTFVLSNFYTAIALSFMAPIFAAVLGCLFLGERIKPLHQLAIAAGIAGVFVIVFQRNPAAGAEVYLGSNLALGNILALVSGVTFGGYFVLARKFAVQHGAVATSTFWQFLFLAVLLAPVTVFTLFRGISTLNYVYLLVFGVFCTAVPLLLVNLSGLFLKAHEMSIVSLSEVPISILLGMALLNEVPSLVVWGGVMLIISAAFLVAAKEG